MRARVADPSGEKLARGAFGARTGDVSVPTDLALLDVDVDRLQSQLPAQLRSADAVSPRVPARDAAHGPEAEVVERASRARRSSVRHQHSAP